MRSVQNLILKVSSRCNLNCSYCYVYNKGDYTFQRQPKFMSDEVVDRIIERAETHVREHKLPYFNFIFHGGEPLLAGKDFFRKFVEKGNRVLSPHTVLRYSLQSNGVLLTEEWCRLLNELGIYAGISFDGMQEMHDRYRVDHAGRGSFQDVVNGMKLIRKFQPLSLLAVVNIESDPAELYNLVKELKAVSYDILLPDATYDSPEPFMNLDNSNDLAPYGEWLVKLYDQWKNDDRESRPTIQFLESILRILLGERSGNALIGNNINDVLVIQTDGSYESPLKVGVDGFTQSNLSVHHHEITAACESNLVNLYFEGHLNLCKQCELCPVNHICGGGLISHRFSKKNEFDNPSVYCKDLMRIITHIQNDLVQSLPAEIQEELGLRMLTYQEARHILKEEINSVTPIHS